MGRQSATLAQSLHNKGTLKTHRLHITLSEAQINWLDSNFDALTPKSVVIRGLIDSAMKNLTGGVEYAPTVSVRDTQVTHASSHVRDLNLQQPLPVEDALNSQAEIDSLISPRPSIGEVIGMESEEGKKKPLVPVSLKKPASKKEIPLALECHSDLIMEFWQSKAGAKSVRAWDLLMTELGKIQERYDDRALRDQLELGAANRWKSVTLKNYELFGMQQAPAQKPQVDWDALDNVSWF